MDAALAPGDYVNLPARMQHEASTQNGAVVEIHSEGHSRSTTSIRPTTRAKKRLSLSPCASRAGARRRTRRRGAGNRGGCRSGWCRGRRGRAVPARRAGRRRIPACGVAGEGVAQQVRVHALEQALPLRIWRRRNCTARGVMAFPPRPGTPARRLRRLFRAPRLTRRARATTGTMRCFEPLPSTVTWPSTRSRSCQRSAQFGDRNPDEYNSSSSARSRNPNGASVGTSTSCTASSTSSTCGSLRATQARDAGGIGGDALVPQQPLVETAARGRRRCRLFGVSPRRCSSATKARSCAGCSDATSPTPALAPSRPARAGRGGRRRWCARTRGVRPRGGRGILQRTT